MKPGTKAVAIPEALHQRLKVKAAREKKSLSALVAALLHDALGRAAA